MRHGSCFIRFTMEISVRSFLKRKQFYIKLSCMPLSFSFTLFFARVTHSFIHSFRIMNVSIVRTTLWLLKNILWTCVICVAISVSWLFFFGSVGCFSKLKNKTKHFSVVESTTTAATINGAMLRKIESELSISLLCLLFIYHYQFILKGKNVNVSI